MRGSPTAQISVAIVCVILGALLMLQYQAHGSILKAQMAESSVDQTTIISNLYESNLGLRKEAEALSAQEAEFARALEQDSPENIQTELDKIRLYNATGPVTGSGVELTVTSDLQAEHVLDLVNEFRNAGAEAIAVNGIRLGVDSAISTQHGVAAIDGFALGDQVAIRAVGNSDTLDRALERKGGVLSYLRNSYPGTSFELTKQSAITLPARGPRPAPRFSTAAE